MVLEFQVLSWDDIITMTLKLGELIKKSNYVPDILIGIARGGLIPLRILSDFFNNPNIAIVNVKLYKDIGEIGEKVEFIQKVEIDIENLKVLLVDDVADTGLTLKAVRDYLLREKNAGMLKIATLHYKPWSIIEPDYYVEKVEKWIVYPWEYVESLKSISEKIEKGFLKGVERDNAERAILEIKENLKKLGFDEIV